MMSTIHAYLQRVSYAMVCFKDKPPFADYCVKASKFISEHQFKFLIEQINYRGGGSCKNAVLEGLCAANQVFGFGCV